MLKLHHIKSFLTIITRSAGGTFWSITRLRQPSWSPCRRRWLAISRGHCHGSLHSCTLACAMLGQMIVRMLVFWLDGWWSLGPPYRTGSFNLRNLVYFIILFFILLFVLYYLSFYQPTYSLAQWMTHWIIKVLPLECHIHGFGSDLRKTGSNLSRKMQPWIIPDPSIIQFCMIFMIFIIDQQRNYILFHCLKLKEIKILFSFCQCMNWELDAMKSTLWATAMSIEKLLWY